MYITWYGTAAVAVETEHSKILFDPFVPLSGSKVKVSKSDFEGFENIAVTHGHVDHIFNIPELVNSSSNIWCTKTPAATLKKNGISESMIHVIDNDDWIDIGDIKLHALQGRHIVYDKAYIKKVVLSKRLLRYFYNVPWFLYQNMRFPENRETLVYEIKTEGKTVLLLGSLGYDENTVYPCDIDVLIMPFQGASNLLTPAYEIIRKTKPGKIILDHFDDTFPPISNTISADELIKFTKKDFPDIEVIIPEYKKPIFF